MFELLHVFILLIVVMAVAVGKMYRLRGVYYVILWTIGLYFQQTFLL
jgi:hypothetical protein